MKRKATDDDIEEEEETQTTTKQKTVSDAYTFNYGEWTQIHDALVDNGVVIIDNVFTEEEADIYYTSIFDTYCKLFKLDPSDPSSWNVNNLPPQVRSGLHQGLVCNFDAIWNIRTHHRVREVFKKMYGMLRENHYDDGDLFTSVDGLNLRPAKHTGREGKDWAHLDQTTRGDPELCIQGQVLLADATQAHCAGFVCSPGSHKVYDVLLDAVDAKQGGNQWCKFNQEDYEKLKDIVIAAGGQWQIPILSRKGSMVLWFSSTVHSARNQGLGYGGTRMVVYVSHRPKDECKKKHAERLQRAIKENRATNHWGTRLFPSAPRFQNPNLSDHVKELVKKPALVYDYTSKPTIDPILLQMVTDGKFCDAESNPFE